MQAEMVGCIIKETLAKMRRPVGETEDPSERAKRRNQLIEEELSQFAVDDYIKAFGYDPKLVEAADRERLLKGPPQILILQLEEVFGDYQLLQRVGRVCNQLSEEEISEIRESRELGGLAWKIRMRGREYLMGEMLRLNRAAVVPLLPEPALELELRERLENPYLHCAQTVDETLRVISAVRREDFNKMAEELGVPLKRMVVGRVPVVGTRLTPPDVEKERPYIALLQGDRAPADAETFLRNGCLIPMRCSENLEPSSPIEGMVVSGFEIRDYPQRVKVGDGNSEVELRVREGKSRVGAGDLGFKEIPEQSQIEIHVRLVCFPGWIEGEAGETKIAPWLDNFPDVVSNHLMDPLGSQGLKVRNEPDLRMWLTLDDDFCQYPQELLQSAG